MEVASSSWQCWHLINAWFDRPVQMVCVHVPAYINPPTSCSHFGQHPTHVQQSKNNNTWNYLNFVGFQKIGYLAVSWKGDMGCQVSRFPSLSLFFWFPGVRNQWKLNSLFTASALCQNRFRVFTGFHWFPSFQKLGNHETRKPTSSVYMIRFQTVCEYQCTI